MTVAASQLAGLGIEEAVRSYLKRRRGGTRPLSKATERIYRERLVLFARFLREWGMPMDVGAIRREHVETFIEWLRTEAPGREGKGQKTATVSIAYRTLRTFFTDLVEEDELRVSPMAKTKQPEVYEEPPAVVRPEQFQRILKTCAGTGFEARRDKALLLVLSCTGMRRGELAGLKAADVDRDRDVVYIEARNSKMRRGRVVKLSREAALAMDRYLRVRSGHHAAAQPWLWLGRRGRLGDSGILQAVERRGREAGVTRLHPHQFRHTFAHNMLSAGMGEQDVAEIAGWRDRTMLARYGRSAAAERALDAFSRMDDAGLI